MLKKRSVVEKLTHLKFHFTLEYWREKGIWSLRCTWLHPSLQYHGQPCHGYAFSGKFFHDM